MTEPVMAAMIYLVLSLGCVAVYGVSLLLMQLSAPVPRQAEVVVRGDRRS